MENYKITIKISTKDISVNINNLYFRDKLKSRALSLKEFKNCLRYLRCYKEGNMVKRNKNGEIIGTFELTTAPSRPFTRKFTTHWKKSSFIHRLRRKVVKAKVDVKYNEIPLMGLKQAELLLIKRALLETNGSIKESAALLDIRPLLLQDKIKKYRLDKEEK